jgi:tetratricopeptide (TPR) repeat protein
MGETVAALSEWVISRHFQSSGNDADGYISKVQSNLTRLDALNQAIKRYNTALGMAKQGSDDLAIIQLKKVINLNSNSIRAYQLLALLVMKAGDTDRAKRYLQKASKIDVSNTITLRYMQELEAPATVSKDYDGNPETEKGSTGAIMPISSYKEDKPNVMAFVNLVIGIVIGIAVMAFLVYPTIKKNVSSSGDTDYTDNGYTLAQIQQKDDRIAELESENTTLEQEKAGLQSELDNLVIPEDNSDNYTSLIDATELYLVELEKPAGDRNFIPIADKLVTITDSDIKIESAVTLLGQLRTATYPSAVENYYTEGHDFYSNEKYEEALVSLQKALTFDPADVDAIYFIARSYHRLGDKENAALYYNMIITDYPDSSRTSDAKDFLEQVQSQ